PGQEKTLIGLARAMLSPVPFDMKEQTRIKQITDGLSHTFMMSEDAGRPQRWQLGVHTQTGEPLDCAWASPAALGFTIGGVGVPVMQQDNDHAIYSFHPNGAGFLFADGHVDFLSHDTEPRIIVAIMTPSSDEIPQ